MIPLPIISLISNIGKFLFGITFISQTLLITQDGDFLQNLTDSVPAQLVYGLSIIYAVMVVLKKVSDLWKDHKLNQLSVKQEQEHLEQEEIKTEKQRKGLDEDSLKNQNTAQE